MAYDWKRVIKKALKVLGVFAIFFLLWFLLMIFISQNMQIYFIVILIYFIAVYPYFEILPRLFSKKKFERRYFDKYYGYIFRAGNSVSTANSIKYESIKFPNRARTLYSYSKLSELIMIIYTAIFIL